MSITTYSEFETNFLVKNGMPSNDINLNKAPRQLKTEIDELNLNKQESLVSGTNIKTINGTSVLGSGNISIIGGATLTDIETDLNFYPVFSADSTGVMTQASVSSNKLYFNPSSGTLNATEFNAFSDINLKENIITIDDALNKVLQLRGVNYYNKNDNSKLKMGVIAQEVQKIIPEVINDSGEFLTVNYNSIIGLLIETVKELNNKIEELKNKI